jgi:hypothetical protein
MMAAPIQLREGATATMTKPILVALAASFLAAGCAVDPADASGEPRAERQYQTGSNIAKKKADGPADGPAVVTREELERVRDNQNPSSFIPKGK